MDWVVYVVDVSQKPHFEKVFEIARRAGWYDPNKVTDFANFRA
jgi:arginyl-tRNA synthetase